MCADFNEGHFNHDPKWIYFTDQREACVACIVENIEDQQISHLQKTSSITLLSKLIQAPDVIEDLKSHPNITCHIVHVILETLLHTNDASFIMSTTEVFLKLAQRLDSEEFIDFMLQDIGRSVEIINSHTELLPVYVLIGRLIQKFPGLSNKFLQHYEPLINKLCVGLCCPEEDVQSAIMFILVYLFESNWEDHLSPRQLTQLCEDLICVLNTAKTQILMMNSLGLVTKLLVSDKWVHFLMTMTVDGVTLLSVLKKMIASAIEVVQQLTIQILSCIIERNEKNNEYCFHILQSDLVEFLFEKLNTRNTQNIENIFKCLLPLSHQDQFYTRNHSVYGIEVLLKTLHTVKTMNHYLLTKKILQILGVIFDRQPTKSPLFVNTTTIKLCIDVIQGVIEHSHPGVFLAAVKMTTAFFRIDHMLRPVPVLDLKIIIQKMSDKVQTFVCENELFEKHKSENKVSLISAAYCQAVLAASKLVVDCKKDPSTCLSAFLAPDTVDNNGSTIESLADLVVKIISQVSVSLAVNLLDDTGNPENSCLLFQLLNSLQTLNPEEHKNTLLQLTRGGLLSKAVNLRCSFGNSHTEMQHVDPCLMAWFIFLYQEENRDGACPGELEIDINNITVRIEDLASHLTHSTMNKDKVFLYSFLLYHCYKNDELIIPYDELMFVLDTFSKEYDNPAELSPFVRKQFVFLWAVLTCMTDNVVELPEKGLQTVLQLVGSCPSSVWYTHHPALLHWSLKDSRVIKICGQHVVLHWLEELCSKECDYQDDPDVAVLYQMFTDVDFLSILVTSLSSMTSKTGKLMVDLIENYISQLMDSDEKGIFLLSLTAITEERMVEIFLHPDQKPEDMKIEFYIQLLMMCDNKNTDDISSSFLKILYHITSWLDEDKDEAIVISCLHLLGGAISYSSTRVVNLMVNSYKFMSLLNNMLKSTKEGLLNASWAILAMIIMNTNGLDEKTFTAIELTITPVEDYMNNINTATPYLQVVSALIQADFTCSVVSLKKTGRFLHHCSCPFTSKDFKILYMYLQQFLLQDINDIKSSAVQCIEDMLRYLKKYAPQIVLDLLKSSWNKILFEVLITITASDLSSLQTTLQLIHVVLEVDEDRTVFNANSDLHQQLSDFLKCVNDEDVVNRDIINSIRNKI